MRTGCITRWFFAFNIVFFTTAFAAPTLYMQVERMNDGVKFTKSYTSLVIMANEMVGLKFVGYYGNDSGNMDYTCKLRRYPSAGPLPDYVFGWEDKTIILGPGQEGAITNIMYIKPSEAIKDTIIVEVALQRGNIPGFMANRFTIYVNAEEAEFDHPVILPEPAYSPGVSNTIRWIPAEGSVSQDVYYFDADDPTNLIKSVQKLYAANGDATGDTLKTTFHDLLDGHNYGYFVKALHYKNTKPVYLHSEIVYSAQDNRAPNDILKPQAIVKPKNLIAVSWKKVKDPGLFASGIKEYHVYRAADTGYEFLIHTEPATGSAVDSLTYFDTVTAGPTYYYRIRAVDKAGNEGYGERSNGVYVPGGGEGDGLPYYGDTGGTGTSGTGTVFIKGPVDTLWVTEDGREIGLKFQAARDSVYNFDNNHPLPMRLFDSGIIPMAYLPTDPLNPLKHYWVFDYTGDGYVDQNFVNGHIYHQRVIRQYAATYDTSYIGSVVPDCYPPTDIYNLKAEAVVEDGSAQNAFSGYSKYGFYIEWEPAEDSGSGLKRYHVYRKIHGMDDEFEELALADSFRETNLVDSLPYLIPGYVNNPLVSYRVIAEDNLGLQRSLEETNWEASDRALGPPVIELLEDNPSLVIYQNADTIYSKKETVLFGISDLDKTDIINYVVSINGNEQLHENIGQDTILVHMPVDEIQNIKIKAAYLGMRSSLWSNAKTVIRAMNIPPQNVTASNDSVYWGGHIRLKWKSPSKDVVRYEIWRWDENGDSTLIGYSTSVADTVFWTDYYDLNELTGQPEAPLVTYAHYSYKVRKLNVFNDMTAFSNTDQSYCNHPPVFVSHEKHDIENGQYAITVTWKRARPTKISADFRTEVRIYQNDLYHLLQTATVTDDDTSYAQFNALVRNNTIFRIRELPNNVDTLMSAWSAPYTVSLDTIDLHTQPQPNGHIFAIWDDPEIVEKYKVTGYQLCRDDVCWTFPSGTVSMMDPAEALEHGRAYKYSIYALDSLNQVVAANAMIDTCDKGSVFIPEVYPYLTRYFNDDSITVEWTWRDINLLPVKRTRGAQKLTLQASISKTFPNQTGQTQSYTFTANPNLTKMRIPIPDNVNRENEVVYLRMGAKDKWGNPQTAVWSSDFYSLKKAIYDTVKPRQVEDLSVASVHAFYKGIDSILVTIHWSGAGVEWPDSAGMYWDYLLGNIAEYRIERSGAGSNNWMQIGEVPVASGSGQYMFNDTLNNVIYSWRIVAVDSAFNTRTGPSVSIGSPVTTPDPPVPLGYRSCQLPEGDADAYAVEIAMDMKHFYLAYEMDPGTVLDQLLCQSGWITDPTFTCTTGWGSIELDTTWFRVKARKGSQGWESGWSDIVFYTDGSDAGGTAQLGQSFKGKPKVFDMSSNFPNPFNAETMIAYQLPNPGFVSLQIYNINGALVRTLINEEKEAGYYSVSWNGRNNNGRDVASGMYISHIYVKTADGQIFKKRHKMTVIK